MVLADIYLKLSLFWVFMLVPIKVWTELHRIHAILSGPVAVTREEKSALKQTKFMKSVNKIILTMCFCSLKGIARSFFLFAFEGQECYIKKEWAKNYQLQQGVKIILPFVFFLSYMLCL